MTDTSNNIPVKKGKEECSLGRTYKDLVNDLTILNKMKEDYVFNNMSPTELALKYGASRGDVIRLIVERKWRSELMAYEAELMRDADREYREFIRKERAKSAKDQLILSQLLTEETKKAIANIQSKYGSLSVKEIVALSRVLSDIVNTTIKLLGLNDEVASYLSNPNLISDAILNKFNKDNDATKLIMINAIGQEVKPKLPMEKVIEMKGGKIEAYESIPEDELKQRSSDEQGE